MKLRIKPLKKFFLLYLLITSCSNPRERKKSEVSFSEEKTLEASINKDAKEKEFVTSNIKTLKFYFENSGSMNGYIKGHYEIKRAISRLLSQIRSEKFNAYLVNTKVYDLPNIRPQDVTESLTPQGVRKGDITTSDLNHILKTILDNTTQNDVSILVTDGIYSVEGNPSDVLSKLEDESNFTIRHFEDRLNKTADLQTLIIKLQSRFDGEYYPVQGSKISLNQQRPYYLWLFGTASKLTAIQKELPITQLPGYKNHVIFQINKSKEPNYSIIPSFMNMGDFRPSRKRGERANTITHVEKDRRTKEFQFSLGVDLSSIPVEKAYLLNAENYQIRENDQYRLVKILPVYDLSPDQVKKINDKRFTHIIVLNTTRNPYGDFNLLLKQQLPSWVKQTHTLDDSKVKGDEVKTLGFAHLINAINNAYSKVSKTKSYFTIPLYIKQ